MHPSARILNRTICLAMCLLVLLCVLPAAATQQLKTVRVGFFAFDGYHMQAADGTRSGYGYDLMQRLAAYTDWQFEYVGYDKSWSEMQDMLERGEIDLLSSAQKTEQRQLRFAFSSNPVGTSSAILTVKAGDSRFTANSYADWRGIRVGMLNGNSRNAGFADYAAEKGFWYTPVYFDNTDQMISALKQGAQIDAALSSDLRSIHDEWVLAEFDPSPFYIIVGKDNASLLNEVDAALDELLKSDYMVLSDLKTKYYTPTSGDEIAFSLAERDFINAANQSGQSFDAILNPDRAPYSSFEDGKPKGIFSDIIKEIVARSGLNVNIIEPSSREEYWRLANSGTPDLRLDAGYNLSEAEEMGYRLTSPYLNVPVARLSRRDAAGSQSVAAVRTGDISRYYADSEIAKAKDIVYYDSLAEVTQAVLEGRQDMAYLYSACAESAEQADQTNRLSSETVFGHSVSFCIAVNARQDKLLYSILNKCVESLRQEEIESVVQSYAKDPRTHYSLVGYIYNHPFVLVGGIVVALAVAALIVLLIGQSRKGKREYAHLMEEERRNEALSVALASAERANASKSTFLSRVSHEMRTPLNGIVGFMALAKDAEPDQIADYLSNAETAAKQLLNVINDVLDMSSIESGKMKIAKAPFDFKHLVHALHALYAAQCAQKGIDYETKLLTPVDEWLVGDQLRVNQVLMNLLGNAMKFTNDGMVTLRISQQTAPGDSVFLRFEVADTGCGMSEEMMSRLFKPFEQESADTAQRYGGSGLGLSIVKNLVSMMDGALTVSSRQGVGTTFTVDLPFGRYDLADVQASVGDEGPRVLVVDDEASERKYLATVLERIGMRYACVENGSLALAELERAVDAGESYDVCIVDWKMPDMSGMEVAMRARQRYGKKLIIVIESAYEHDDANDVARQAGANLFVSKPLFQSSLLDLLSTLTGGRVSVKTQKHEALDLKGMRVLLAEDNAMNRRVVSALVEKVGVACDQVEDGRQAVDKFLAEPPGTYDAILMDIQMPVMDGFEATRAIREASGTHMDAQSVQIIALTANAFSEDIAMTLASGMNAHVAKPVDPDALFAVLDRAYRLKRG